jgi:hypothetical protein
MSFLSSQLESISDNSFMLFCIQGGSLVKSILLSVTAHKEAFTNNSLFQGLSSHHIQGGIGAASAHDTRKGFKLSAIAKAAKAQAVA